MIGLVKSGIKQAVNSFVHCPFLPAIPDNLDGNGLAVNDAQFAPLTSPLKRLKIRCVKNQNGGLYDFY